MKNGDGCIGETEDRILRMRSYCSYSIYDIVMITYRAKTTIYRKNTKQRNLADKFLHTIFFTYEF